MPPTELTLALVRTTLATAAAACLVALLLAGLQINSPRIHRAAWLLVVVQGWLLIPWTVKIQTAAPLSDANSAIVIQSSPVGGVSDADFALHQLSPAIAQSPANPTSAWACTSAIAVWSLGAAALTIFAAVRYARIVTQLPRGIEPADAAWQTQWRRTLAAARIEQRTDFRLTDCLGPLVAFVPFRYLVLAPRTLWLALTRRERAAILRHELAHIRRRDLWKSLAIRILALPQWFNPLVWLAVRRFDEAAEWSCDAAAARGLAHRRSNNRPRPGPHRRTRNCRSLAAASREGRPRPKQIRYLRGSPRSALDHVFAPHPPPHRSPVQGGIEHETPRRPRAAACNRRRPTHPH